MNKVIDLMNKNAPDGISFYLGERDNTGNIAENDADKEVYMHVENCQKSSWSPNGDVCTGMSLKHFEKIVANKEANFSEHKKALSTEGMYTNIRWGGGGYEQINFDDNLPVETLITTFHELMDKRAECEQIEDDNTRRTACQSWGNSIAYQMVYGGKGRPNCAARIAVRTALKVSEKDYQAKELMQVRLKNLGR